MIENWHEEKLGLIAEKITKGGTPTTYGFTFQKSGINFLKVENIQNGRINLTSITDYISLDAYEFQRKSQLFAGDVLFSIAGTIGVTAVVEQHHLPANTNQALAIIKGTEKCLNRAFLSYQLEYFVQKIKSKARGGAMNNVSLEDLKDFIVKLAPLAEQQRIVAKIEELFSVLDKGIETLKTAKDQLKLYRQAVLKYAFEGRLTNPYLEEGELPDGWGLKKIEDVAEIIGGIAFKSTEFLKSGKFQVIRMGNVRPGIIRYDESPVFLDKIVEKTQIKGQLRVNDVIITQTGTKGKRDYGFTALINKEDLLLNQRISAMRCNQLMMPKFLLYFTWTRTFQNQFFANETGNVGQGNVGIKGITKSLVPCPNIQIQNAIIQEIESRLSICDKIEASIEQGLQQAEALRQSILKKAFEGKLVTQDPNDEPAHALLERIKKEREAVQPVKKQNKAKT